MSNAVATARILVQSMELDALMNFIAQVEATPGAHEGTNVILSIAYTEATTRLGISAQDVLNSPLGLLGALQTAYEAQKLATV